MQGLIETSVARSRFKRAFARSSMGLGRTTLVASILGLGLFATLYAAAHFQAEHYGNPIESMHAPSRSAPSRLTGVSMRPLKTGPHSSTLPPAVRP